MRMNWCPCYLTILVNTFGCGSPKDASQPGEDTIQPQEATQLADAPWPAEVGTPSDVFADIGDLWTLPDDLHQPGDGPADVGVPVPQTPTCDDLEPKHCLLPWPSSLYLAPDPTRVTGVTLTFGAESLPKNNHGVPIDPAPWRRLDGYGTATTIVTYFPNLDRSKLAGEDTIERSLEADHQSLLLEVGADGKTTRVPHWLEIDGRAVSGTDDQVLLLRPARLLKPATRYVVGFRKLTQSDGTGTKRSVLFQAYVDGKGDARQARMNDVFAILASAGAPTSELTLAWDFNTASDAALHGTMIEMRDKALAAVGPEGPKLTVKHVVEHTLEENEHIAFEVSGTFKAPLFLKTEQTVIETKAWRFNQDASGKLVQDGYRDEPFWVRVPRSALDGKPHGLFMHGHGQNGSGDQVRADNISRVCNEHHFITYATDLRGMSEEDVENILALILDLSHFYWLADRLHQGVVNHVLLNLAMEKQLPKLDALTSRGVVVNTAEHYYQGISQGGIYGPTIVALSPYIQRGHFGVPGSNYSLLLSRSKNFDAFYTLLDIAYPDRIDQALSLVLIHGLWEQSDSASWYRRLALDPLPGEPVNQVLLAPAKGDHQVAVVSNEIVARSGVGVSLLAHYATDRKVFGVTEAPYPHTGSGMVLYDFGNPWPPPGSNLPPTTVDVLGDPHGRPRQLKSHNQQMVHFWRTGEIIDVCGGDGCTPE